jgi:hypothetical protein
MLKQRREGVVRSLVVIIVDYYRVMDRADILNALRETGRVNDSSDEGESATLTRLQELQVKRDAARYECYAGSQRRLVNQHRAGVVSRYTLRDILKMGSEHLLTCLMYSGVDGHASSVFYYVGQC